MAIVRGYWTKNECGKRFYRSGKEIDNRTFAKIDRAILTAKLCEIRLKLMDNCELNETELNLLRWRTYNGL
jgi:hypothetical protein